MTVVTLSLISHTNVGKTTLARTLLRRDVGQVLDQAHVTDSSEAHVLVAADGHELRLWDTPGFGDTARLLRRLRRQGDPLGWLLHQVWDRLADRPLFCSQQAVSNVRDQADLVLYLVNAAEEPGDAGYVGLELELLAWLGKPVVLLLNQTGAADGAADGEAGLAAWRAAVAGHPIVADVLSLDAFTRCWVQEDLLLSRLAPLLEGERRAAMEALAAAWTEARRATHGRIVAALADHVARAAADAVVLGEDRGGSARRRAVEELAGRQVAAARALTSRLLELHGLDGGAADEVQRRLADDFDLPPAGYDPRKGALWGGVVTGAAGGLAADVMAGGLSLGGGILAGAIAGALGGAGLAKGFERLAGSGPARVGWSREGLLRLAREALLRALAVAHFGRGRGAFVDAGRPERWARAVDAALQSRERPLRAALQAAARRTPAPGGPGAARDARDRERASDVDLSALLDAALAEVYVGLYPEARALLD